MQTPKPHRKPWSIGFPDVWIHADELKVKHHPNYMLAKSGDTDQAALLVNDLISADVIEQMRSLQSFSPILISVHAEEEMGKNATGKPFSAKLSLSAPQLAQLREKHEHIETWWLEYFGFGFDCLTESEARYLIRTSDAEHIRDRIIAST